MWECVLTVCVFSGFCISGRGLNYAGNVNISKSGRQCQHWRHSFPHPIMRCKKCLFPSNYKEFALIRSWSPLSRKTDNCPIIWKKLTSNMLRNHPPTHSSSDAYPKLGYCSLAFPIVHRPRSVEAHEHLHLTHPSPTLTPGQHPKPWSS